MSGEKRRENLLKILQESDKPVSGTKLAEKFQVSRQVVVQDISFPFNCSNISSRRP